MTSGFQAQRALWNWNFQNLFYGASVESLTRSSPNTFPRNWGVRIPLSGMAAN
jgi:hypothetical protein